MGKILFWKICLKKLCNFTLCKVRCENGKENEDKKLVGQVEDKVFMTFTCGTAHDCYGKLWCACC